MAISEVHTTEIACDNNCGYAVTVRGDEKFAAAEVERVIANGRWERRDGRLVCVLCLALEGKWGRRSQVNAARQASRLTGKRIEIPSPVDHEADPPIGDAKVIFVKDE